ncbi:MAG: O-antigen ligase family protein, partial [Anaerolineae bacterium]|nr:O-antigen ligase family protein [Anaerolineae bacterium]
ARQRVIEGWLLGAVTASAIGIVQMAIGRNLISAEGISRVRGVYGSPNNLALYLERALPVLVAFAWLGRVKIRRMIYGVAALIVFVGVVLTFSRGALLLGVPVSVLALGLLQQNRKAAWLTVGAVGILALGVVLLAVLFSDRFRVWFDPTIGTGFIRLKLWRATWNMIADYPLRGVGLDNFLYLYRTRYVLPSAWNELDLSHPHNLLLDAWTRLGLAGVIVIGWLLGWFFHRTWGKVPVFGDNRTLVLGVTASMLAVLAHGLVDHAIFLVDLAFVFMLLLAMVQSPKAPKGG